MPSSYKKRRYGYSTRNRGYQRRGLFRRRYRRRYTSVNKRSQRITKSKVRGTLIADRTYVKLKYYATVNFTTGSGIIIKDYLFRGNSLFDPDYQLGGTQPLGYDQWSAFYNRYMVFGSKIRVQFINLSSLDPLYTSVVPIGDAAALTPYNDAISELPYVRTSILSNGSGSKTVGFLNSYMRTKKIFGISGSIDPEEYGATTGTGPNQEWYWAIRAYSIPGNPLTATAFVTLTYYVRFFDRNIAMGPS